MKVYLAGKIAKNDWRNDLVPMLPWAFSAAEDKYCAGVWDSMPMYRKDFHYVGPYFLSCDHGCAHGESTHGGGETCCDNFRHGGDLAIRRDDISDQCAQAIRDCDVLFAWLEDPCTAFGTLVEIGMARTLGKKVVIGCADHHDDLWFVYRQANYVHINPTPELSFKEWANLHSPVDEERAKCESPLELAFWDAYLCRKPSELQGMIAQHPVSAGGINYRLDFALPERKVAFEMDGYTYHGKEREHFNRDRRRDLNLKLAGWEVHRFDGDLIRDDTPRVIEIAAQLAKLAATPPVEITVKDLERYSASEIIPADKKLLSRRQQLQRMTSKERAEFLALELLKQELETQPTVEQC